MRVLTNDTELRTAGALPCYIGTAWMWYRNNGGVPDTSHVDVDRIDYAIKEARKLGRLHGEPFVIDIEEFSLVTQFDCAVTQLLTAIWRAKSTLPDTQVGLYCVLPERNYWSPVLRAEYLRKWNRPDQFWSNVAKVEAWNAHNDKVARALLPSVDFLVVDPYAIYPARPGQEEENAYAWRLYADANMTEALRVSEGKPVYAILMPSYGATAIEPGKWKMMVEFIASYPRITGLIIHVSDSHVCDKNWRLPVMEVMK